MKPAWKAPSKPLRPRSWDDWPKSLFSAENIYNEMENLESGSNLGPLDALPTELSHLILGRLDMISFLQFRRVSRSAMSMTCAMPESRLLDPGCHPGIRRMIRWKMDIAVADIYSSLIRRRCSECREPTAYVLLYNALRLCVNCSQLPQYHFVPIHLLEEVGYRLSTGSIKGELEFLRQLLFSEGVSLVAVKSGEARVWCHFVLADDAIDVLVGLGAGPKEVLEEVSSIRGYFRRHNRTLQSLPWYSTETGRLESEFAT